MRDISNVQGSSSAWEGVYETELLSNTHGDALATFVYGRSLDPSIDGAWAERLADELNAIIVLRARQQRIVASRGGSEFLVQENELNGRRFPQHLMDYVFFQTNALLNHEMQRWVVAQTRSENGEPEGQLLELYCGNGNLTLPAAQNFHAVLATEINRRAVAAARVCATEAGVRNVRFVRLKSEETRRAFPPGYRPHTLLVDPPRGGLDECSLELAKAFKRIIYISCHPETLRRDLLQLRRHRVAAACLFDQFPWTDHVEVGVRLEFD